MVPCVIDTSCYENNGKKEELHVLLWQLAKWLEFSTQVVHNYSRAIVLFIDTIVSFIGNKTKIHCLDNV